MEVLVVNGLEPNTDYIFKVQAESVDGTSKESESNVIRTLIPIPSKPEHPKVVSVTHNSVSLEWAKPTQYAKYVTDYCVSYCSEEQQSTKTKVNVEEKIVTINGLLPETMYIYRVQAQSETGFSETSEVSISTLPPKPSQPGQPQPVNLGHDKITIVWAKPQENAKYIQNYTVKYTKDSETHAWTTVNTVIVKEVLEVNGLEPNTNYIFKVQAESTKGCSKESEVSNAMKTRSPIPSQPGKPTYRVKAHDRITLVWSKPNEYYENVECYEISYFDNKIEKTRKTDGRVEEIEIDGLDPQKGYYFKVKAKSMFGNSLNSLPSDQIGTDHIRPILKIITYCTALPDSPTIRLLNTTKSATVDEKKYAKFEYGEATHGTPNKVLMIVGATGSGKSTLINGMVNYLLGVEWDDEFRLKLIHEEVKSQTKSVTKFISAYTFHKHDDFPLQYSLTIIDTPGFGDTEGMARDKEITSQIQEFFSLSGEQGIDHLDGIGFVTQGGLARLTPTQIYIFDSIFSIFGKDMKDNIFTMVTFADSAVPPVIGAVKEAGIPCTEYFKFNNSALYTVNTNTSAKVSWEITAESLKKFFDKFGLSPATKYVFKVQAGSVNHQFGEETKESNIMTKYITPGRPGKPHCVKIEDSKVQLKWTKPVEHAETVEHYFVFYYSMDDNIRTWHQYSRTSVLEEMIVTGLTPFTRYNFTVQAISKHGSSEKSDTSETVQTLVPKPGAPGQPEAVSVTHNSVNLKWAKPAQYPQYVMSYYVYYRSQEKQSKEWSLLIVTGEKENVEVTSLSPKTTYLFKVQAISKSGPSKMSDISMPVCTSTPVPSQPGQPQPVDITHNKITITWAKPQENAEHVQNYVIQYIPLNTFNNYWWKTVKTKSAVEELIVGELEPNTSYIFKVHAESVDGPGKESETSHGIKTLVPIPSKPGQPKVVSVTHNSVNLKWTKPTQYSEYVMNYCVSYCSQEDVKQILLNVETENVTVTGLSPKTEYFFRVKAQSETGSSEVSEVNICTSPPLPSQPGQPQAVNISHDVITITWAKPQENAEHVQNYAIHYKPLHKSGSHSWRTVKTENAVEVLVVSRLNSNTDYIFKVQAESADGPSEVGKDSNIIKTRSPIPSQPGKPTYKTKAHDRITLIWSKPNEYYENVECYKISYSDNKKEQTKITDGRVEEIEIDGLDPQKGYYFKVKAKSKFGNSLNSLSSDLIGTNPVRPILKIIPHCKKL